MVSNVYFVTLQEFVVACSDTHLSLCQWFGNLRRLSVSDILLDGVELFSCGAAQEFLLACTDMKSHPVSVLVT